MFCDIKGPYCTFWKEVTTCGLKGSPHWELCSLRAQCLHKLSGILLHERFTYSLLFIYWVIYLYQHWLWLFLLFLGSNPELLYLSAQIVSALDIGSSFKLAIMSLQYVLIIMFLGYFLSCWHRWMLQTHLLFSLSQSLESAISLRALVPFIGEWH